MLLLQEQQELTAKCAVASAFGLPNLGWSGPSCPQSDTMNATSLTSWIDAIKDFLTQPVTNPLSPPLSAQQRSGATPSALSPTLQATPPSAGTASVAGSPL